MTAAVAAGSRRARILAHLEDHPGLTIWELSHALGLATGSLTSLLRDMERRAQVVTAPERRAQQGRQVSLWYVAPPGTVPPDVSPEAAERRRRRSRESARRRRARARGLAVAPGGGVPPIRGQAHLRAAAAGPLPSGAACQGADPSLFFPGDGDEDRRALAICARCPVRRQCYDRARANGEPWGIWGGVNFAAPARAGGRRAS
jgi:WhiB family redox-sensing transcriptional regulator